MTFDLEMLKLVVSVNDCRTVVTVMIDFSWSAVRPRHAICFLMTLANPPNMAPESCA